jgi:hypothetical protein
LINLITFCYVYMRIKKLHHVHIAKEKLFLTCLSHVEHIINLIIIHKKYINWKKFEHSIIKSTRQHFNFLVDNFFKEITIFILIIFSKKYQMHQYINAYFVKDCMFPWINNITFKSFTSYDLSKDLGDIFLMFFICGACLNPNDW